MELEQQTTQEPPRGEAQALAGRSQRRTRALIVIAGVLAAAPFIAAGLAMSVQVSMLPSAMGWYPPIIILQSALLVYGFGVGIIGLIASALSSTEHGKEASAALIIIGAFFMTLGPAARSFAVDLLLGGKPSAWVFLFPVALFMWAASLLIDARRVSRQRQ